MKAFVGLRFVPTKKKDSKPTRVSNKVVKGYCIVDADGTYKVHVTLDDNTKLLLPFTLDSFDCSGREIVFSSIADKNGIKTMYVRRDRELKLYPGVSVSPIAENRTFSGYVVRHNGILKFQLKEYICYGNCNETSNED